MTCQKNHALTGLSSSEESWHYMTTIRVPPEASSEIHPSLPTFPSIDRNPSVTPSSFLLEGSETKRHNCAKIWEMPMLNGSHSCSEKFSLPLSVILSPRSTDVLSATQMKEFLPIRAIKKSAVPHVNGMADGQLSWSVAGQSFEAIKTKGTLLVGTKRNRAVFIWTTAWDEL